ncbi:hypothetical protein PAM_369 [Onion yellows phytoplasma OY-M]|uniref:Uncharacterized protein n=1 Tax=Onion yellows phytoplasma (strain OY-M) TaxID=262768 RepID=Q6YQK4_ONYPE|nr:hypothetical protein PAM_329 [Onion yellows phytoplasma OY-M]BAD04454.1 hypothetical protein PAM_369 [Onion yellows phytoplasma OY-M]
MFNIKKIIKWFFIILVILLFLIIVFIMLTDPNKLPKEKIPILKETAFENIEEWYDDNEKCTMIKAKYTFDGLNGVGYYQQQLQEKKVVITIFRSLKNASKPKKNLPT